jgi:hypothetical protein
MRYLSVKNLETYQHYKDRDPKWIKLYYSILDDEAFIFMDETLRCRYMTCLILASRSNNKIPADPQYLKKVMRLDKVPNLQPLIDIGFLVYTESRLPLDECTSPLSLSPLLSSPLSSPNPNGEKIVKKRGLREIDEDDKPTDKHRDFARSLGLDAGPEWGKFKNYCKAHGKKYVDFEAAFRNWLASPLQQKGKS